MAKKQIDLKKPSTEVTAKKVMENTPQEPLTKGRFNSCEGWTGTHCGKKRGKKLTATSGAVDKKAAKRLAARKQQHAQGINGQPGYESKSHKGRQVPGSMKKVC